MRLTLNSWWFAPVAAWLAMLAALALCLALPRILAYGSFFLPTLAVSAAMLLTLAFGLAGVRSLSPINRVAAGAAFLFLALLLLLSFVDLSTRLSGGLQPRSPVRDSL
jgi:amino acid transporter